MIKYKRGVWTAISALVLGGCAGSLENPLAVEKIHALTPGESRVILSVGARSGCLVNSTFLAIRPYRGGYFSREALILVDHVFTQSDFSDEQGTLSAISLPPGKYRAFTMSMHPYVHATTVPRFAFTVGPDENVYIGNFFMPQSCGMENLVRFTDRSQRDLALLAQRNPLLASSVVTRVARFDGYIGEREGDPSNPAATEDQQPGSASARQSVAPRTAPMMDSYAPGTRSGEGTAPRSETAPAPAPAPLPSASQTTDLAPKYLDYVSQVTAEVQDQARSILTAQTDLVAERDRPTFTTAFDLSIARSSAYIRERILHRLTASLAPGELQGRETVTSEQDSSARRAVQLDKGGWTLALVRSAWVGACTQAVPSASKDCSVYMTRAEDDLVGRGLVLP